MKTKLITIIFLIVSTWIVFPQGKTTVFSFTPVSKKISKVNGLALGVGHLLSSEENKVIINGLNLEINPLTPFIILAQEPSSLKDHKVKVISNGLHAAIGGFSGGAIVNGVGISAYNVTLATNGLSLNGVYNYSSTLNGLHISGLFNYADKGAGVLLSPINYTKQFAGLNTGVYNYSESFTSLQIGIINHAKNLRGLQIGLWNKNQKRSLPLINW